MESREGSEPEVKAAERCRKGITERAAGIYHKLTLFSPSATVTCFRPPSDPAQALFWLTF